MDNGFFIIDFQNFNEKELTIVFQSKATIFQ